MPSLHFDHDQHFTCQGCATCCRGWRVPVLAGEVEALRSAGAQRLCSDGPGRDPFRAVERGLFRLRLTANGDCVFLSPEGRCRIHAELGAERKPLACRTFPFQPHAVAGGQIVCASFSCPTVARNEGLPLPERAQELGRLADEWRHAFPSPDREPSLAGKRPLDVGTLRLLRKILIEILERPGADGRPDLRANAGRAAWWLEDLSRRPVARLAPDRLADYLSAVGRHAAGDAAGATAPRPSAFTYLLARGYLFAAASARERRRPERGRWLAQRARSIRLLGHIHGVGPAPAGFRLARARDPRWPGADDAVWRHAARFLRSGIVTLGTGRWPVVTEIGVIVATLNAAFALAGMRTDDGRIEEGAFLASLSEAADLQTMSRGIGAQALGMLGGGVGALRVLASGRLA